MSAGNQADIASHLGDKLQSAFNEAALVDEKASYEADLNKSWDRGEGREREADKTHRQFRSIMNDEDNDSRAGTIANIGKDRKQVEKRNRDMIDLILLLDAQADMDLDARANRIIDFIDNEATDKHTLNQDKFAQKLTELREEIDKHRVRLQSTNDMEAYFETHGALTDDMLENKSVKDYIARYEDKIGRPLDPDSDNYHILVINAIQEGREADLANHFNLEDQYAVVLEQQQQDNEQFDALQDQKEQLIEMQQTYKDAKETYESGDLSEAEFEQIKENYEQMVEQTERETLQYIQQEYGDPEQIIANKVDKSFKEVMDINPVMSGPGLDSF